MRGIAIQVSTFVGVLLSTLVGTGCRGSGSTGGNGQPCTNTPGSLLGPLTCNSGLVCNLGMKPTAVCQPPNTNGVGGPCDGLINCQVGLWCEAAYQLTCMAPLPIGATCIELGACGLNGACLGDGSGSSVCVAAGGEGEPCNSLDACADGLTCAKVNGGSPTCVGAGNSVAVAPGDAGDSGDATAAITEGGAEAGTIPDAGEVDGTSDDGGPADTAFVADRTASSDASTSDDSDVADADAAMMGLDANGPLDAASGGD